MEAILTILEKLPTSYTLTVTLLAIIATLWIKYKKVVSEEKETDNSIRNVQVESLVQQITLLSSELEKTRTQLKELHDQNLELMTELRNANKRIGELEVALDRKHYEFKSSQFLEFSDTTFLPEVK